MGKPKRRENLSISCSLKATPREKFKPLGRRPKLLCEWKEWHGDRWVRVRRYSSMYASGGHDA
jgi:hypothetical protein